MLKNGVIMKTTSKYHHHHQQHQLSLWNSVLAAACCCCCCRFVMVLACCCCCCGVPLFLYDNNRVSGFTVVNQSYHHHCPMRLLTANFIRTPTTVTSGDNNNNNLARNNNHCVRSSSSSSRPTSKIWQQYDKNNNNNDEEGEKFETLKQVDDDETTIETTAAAPDFDSLIDMDVVVYSFVDDPLKEKRFAALQEDGILSPLSVWTTEPAFGNSIEFLVDEEERFMLAEEMTESRRIELHYLIDESSLSYGSRQCQRGVSNPHGEENELLYYIDKDIVERFDAKVDVKPELEILW
mmetsp:Transcript_35323/g.85488  ORF Transcript_35323/g.85488 Transcript_35323/m.85488 type:complete len:294 (+) Transcript_35323:211-1092(+)